MLSPDGQRSLGLLLVHLAPEVAEAAAEAKVGDLGVLVVVNEDVPGGEVAMDDFLGREIFHSFRYLVAECGEVSRGQLLTRS